MRKAQHLTPSSLKLYKNTSCGCSYNKDKRVSLVEMIKRVESNTVYEVTEAEQLWTSKWVLRCKQHGLFRINYSSVHDGSYGCPSCASFGFNPTKDAYFYVNSLSKDGVIVAYKYGITNQPLEKRMRQIVVNSEYEIDNIFYFKSNGYLVKELEDFVKILLPSSYLTKEQIRSGFTETIHPIYIIQLNHIFEQFLKKE